MYSLLFKQFEPILDKAVRHLEMLLRNETNSLTNKRYIRQ